MPSLKVEMVDAPLNFYDEKRDVIVIDERLLDKPVLAKHVLNHEKIHRYNAKEVGGLYGWILDLKLDLTEDFMRSYSTDYTYLLGRAYVNEVRGGREKSIALNFWRAILNPFVIIPGVIVRYLKVWFYIMLYGDTNDNR